MMFGTTLPHLLLLLSLGSSSVQPTSARLQQHRQPQDATGSNNDLRDLQPPPATIGTTSSARRGRDGAAAGMSPFDLEAPMDALRADRGSGNLRPPDYSPDSSSERFLNADQASSSSAGPAKCRPLLLREWVNLLQSETASEFDVSREAASIAQEQFGDDFNAALLIARAEQMWSDSTSFEWGRGRRVREGRGKPTPYVVCLEGDKDEMSESSGGESAGRSGFWRRRIIRDAIKSAIESLKSESKSTGMSSLRPVHTRVVLKTLYSDDTKLCGYALMDADVAENVEFEGCVVQPVLMAMKLMPRTVSLVMEKARECSDELQKDGEDGGEGAEGQQNGGGEEGQQEEGDGDERHEKDDNIIASTQKDEGGTGADGQDEQQPTVLETLLGSDKDGEEEETSKETRSEGGAAAGATAAAEVNTASSELPSCEAIDNLTSPTVDITFCPGSVGADMMEALAETDSDAAVDVIDEMTSWMTSLLTTGTDSTTGDASKNVGVADEVYWTSALPGGAAAGASGAENSGRSTSSRAQFWREIFDEASGTASRCEEVYATNLTWTVQPPLDVGDTEDSVVLRVVYDGTFAESWEKGCALSLIAALAVREDVCAMEIVGEADVQNYNAQWMVQSGLVGVRPWFDVGLDGEGQVVAMSDTGIDVNNCYFYDANNPRPPNELDTNGHRKVAQYWPHADDVDVELGHGTHVAATIAGSRAPKGTDEEPGAANGVAQAAKLAFVDISSSSSPGMLMPPKDSDLLSTGRDNAGAETSPIAHIHSMSWGAKQIRYYNNQARMFDNYLFENDDFIVVIAAGNEGRYDEANSLSTPSNAKNVLSVGASHSYGMDLGDLLGPSYVADFSSRGPTEDGRMKPDLVAQGKYILSAAARPNQPGACDPPGGELPGPQGNMDGLHSLGGTSQAAPVVAGTAALVRQYFEEGWYVDGTKNSGPPRSPSGALVKAVLMNGAQTNMNGVDNGSKGVTPVKPYDNTIGFGRVSLTDSLYIAGKSDVQVKFWDREIISDGDDVRTYDITIDTSNGCKIDYLSVTLVWMEKGSPSGCTKCVQNDLDMYITEKGKETIKYFPNGRSAKDSINNVERTIVNGVIDGDAFTVHVNAHNLVELSQKYALVATGCFAGFANELDTIERNVFSMDETRFVEKDNSSTTMILIIVCSVLGAVVLLCICFAFYRRKRVHRAEKELESAEAPPTTRHTPQKRRDSRYPSLSPITLAPSVSSEIILDGLDQQAAATSGAAAFAVDSSSHEAPKVTRAEKPVLNQAGGSIRFEDLGPVIKNPDGSSSHIDNWESMTEQERKVTWKMISEGSSEVQL